MLYERVVEVDERLDASGMVLRSLEIEHTKRVLEDAYREGYRTLAVCLIHAYVNPVHELAIKRLAEEIGFQYTVLSHEVAPMIKAVSRGETTVVDAYLTPIVQGYLQRVRAQFQQPDPDDLLVMTSAGGLVAAEQYRERIVSYRAPLEAR